MVLQSDYKALYLLQPIAVESLGPINDSITLLVNDLGRRIADIFQVRYEKAVSFFSGCHLSLLIQPLNAVLIHDSFVVEVVRDWHSS